MANTKYTEVIGTASIKDEKAFRTWLKKEGQQRGNDTLSGWYGSHWQEYFYKNRQIFNDLQNIFEHSYEASNLFLLITELESYNLSLNLYFDDGFAAIVGYGGQQFVFPSEWLDIKCFTDMSEIPSGAFAALTGETAQKDKEGTGYLSVLPKNFDGTITARSVKEGIKDTEKELEDLKEYQKKLKQHDLPEFAAINAQIAKLKAEAEEIANRMKVELEKKKEEFERMKEELEKKLFLLETCIYGIRCYTGEVIKVAQLTDGKEAEKDAPVVLYAKIRFLDEELGKYLSVYDYGDEDSDQNTFMQILKNRKDLQELLAPGEKSISILKASRSGNGICQSGKIANSLKSYEKIHGKQLAILIRNGERIYISWLDEDKIVIPGDDFIFEAGSSTRPYEEGEERFIHTPSKEEVASRYFLVQVLNGILQRKNILSLPDKVNILKPGKYVIYSMASGWLNDTRYGTFGDILKKTELKHPKKGDRILTLLQVTRDDIYEKNYHGSSMEYTAWNNDRGIGERNRTKGVCVGSRKIMTVNRIVRNFRFDIRYRKEWYKCIEIIKHNLKKIGNGESYSLECIHEKQPYQVKENLWETMWYNDTEKLPILEEILESYKEDHEGVVTMSDEKVKYVYDLSSAELTETASDIYVSVPMEQWDYAKRTAYTNFKIENTEYIPLTFLCSEWIDYVIATGQVTGFRLPGEGQISFAVALEYLNIIKAYLTKRESEEKDLIQHAFKKRDPSVVQKLDPVMSGTEWTKYLSEWKIANDVHKLHTKNVGKFVDYLLDTMQ